MLFGLVNKAYGVKSIKTVCWYLEKDLRFIRWYLHNNTVFGQCNHQYPRRGPAELTPGLQQSVLPRTSGQARVWVRVRPSTVSTGKVGSEGPSRPGAPGVPLCNMPHLTGRPAHCIMLQQPPRCCCFTHFLRSLLVQRQTFELRFCVSKNL